MFDLSAYLGGEGVEGNLAYADEKDAKGDVAEGPAIFEGVEDQGDLENDIDEEEDAVEDVENDEEGGGGSGRERSP